MHWNRDLFAQADLASIPQDWKDKAFSIDAFAAMVRKLAGYIGGIFGTSLRAMPADEADSSREIYPDKQRSGWGLWQAKGMR